MSDTDGAALFDITGAPTQLIDNAKRYLSELHQMEQVTNQFCKFIAGHNLFTPLGLRIQDGGKTKEIAGCYVINEERLSKVSDELFLSMRAKQYLSAIYVHLLSLGQTERLVTLQKGWEASRQIEGSS